jgi:two-component system LytT family sensor kinase
MPNTHEPLLVNTVGHSAGAIVFGIFLFLLIRDGAATRLRGNWRSLAAAALAFLWNACSLAVMAAGTRAATEPEILIAATFSILSVLPAILLDLSLGNSLRSLVRAGYALSAAAVGLHFIAAFTSNPRDRTTAFLLITAGFACLTVIALIVLAIQHDRAGRTKRMAGAMCSALFAISFVHFGSQPAHAWSNELALHHAGLPLALFVLLQDYRFVLLDAFIRLLANALLAAILTFAVIRATSKMILLNSSIASNPLYEALLLIGLCLLLIIFALLRNTVQRWLTKVVFRRPDLEKILRELRSGPALLLGETDYLTWAAQLLGHFMGAGGFDAGTGQEACFSTLTGTELAFPAPVANVPPQRHDPVLEWAEVVIPIRLGPGELRYIVLGRRRGGRRYLSRICKR